MIIRSFIYDTGKRSMGFGGECERRGEEKEWAVLTYVI